MCILNAYIKNFQARGIKLVYESGNDLHKWILLYTFLPISERQRDLIDVSHWNLVCFLRCHGSPPGTTRLLG